jgi:uncharacterized protein (TIGR02145 family)
MKKLYVLVAALLVSGMSFAQAPTVMGYQTVVREGNGALVVGRAVGIQISILLGSAQGTAVYREKQAAITNVNGLVSLEIGKGITSDDFAMIDWSVGLYFIKTETDLTGGSNYSITGTSKLMSVPYAFQSKKADNGITSDQAADITANKAKLGQNPGTTVGDMEYWDGSSWVVIGTTPNEADTLQMIGGLPTWVGGGPLTIGTQIWMVKNLDIATYTDGTIIPEVRDATEWSNLKTGAWCHFDNNAANDLTYGKLYNWYAVMGINAAESSTPTSTEVGARKQLGPVGFHIPTGGDWAILANFLEGQVPIGNVGGKMKEAGTTFWRRPNSDATNTSGFNGLPGGYRLYTGDFAFKGIGIYAKWWMALEILSPLSYSLYCNDGFLRNFAVEKASGFSVRCVKD